MRMVKRKISKVIIAILIPVVIFAAAFIFYVIRSNTFVEPSINIIPKDVLNDRLEQLEENSTELLGYYRKLGEYCYENSQERLHYVSNDIFNKDILSDELNEAVEKTDLLKVYGGCETITTEDYPYEGDALGVLFLDNILMADTSRTDYGQIAVYGICYLYDDSYAKEIEKWKQTYVLKKLDSNLYIFCKLYRSHGGYCPYETLG